MSPTGRSFTAAGTAMAAVAATCVPLWLLVSYLPEPPATLAAVAGAAALLAEGQVVFHLVVAKLE